MPHPHFSRVSLKEEVFPEENPLVAYDRLFSGVDSGMNDAAAKLRLAQQKSVLDAANADLLSLSQSLPPSEKRKIDSYTTALRDMEHRLSDPQTMQACNLAGFNPTGFTVPQVGDPNQAAYNQADKRPVVATCKWSWRACRWLVDERASCRCCGSTPTRIIQSSASTSSACTTPRTTRRRPGSSPVTPRPSRSTPS